ncbi:GGT1 [Bugula neritina]|uniref:GGT1 n=1 Tax=Bugula neritina TaxID=10212 RepID=A0A7J7JWX6_BUGNE|nr:GGT1 [Bugula neritina]
MVGFPEYSVDHRPGLLQILSSSEKTNLINLVVDDKTGRGKEEGTMITRPDYAQALDLIAKDPDNFYLSDIGQDIIDSVNGNITLEDLSSYKAIATEILKMNYSDYVLETPGPPAGGAALLHMLKILEGYKFSPADIAKDLTVHRIIEAMKFGFAAYPNIAEFNDTEQSKEFTQNMLSAQHCEKLRLNITDNSTHDESYYNPQYDVLPTEGTSVVTAIDNDELFVSSISSLNSHFGSAVMTKKYGIILNNFLDAYDHAVDGLLPKHGINNNNIVKGGRRPRSAMAPVIFYNRHRKCKKRGVVGSTGGLKAIPATLQYLLNILSFDATPEDSNKRPRYYNTLIPNTTHVEDNLPTETTNSLRNKLHFTVSHDKPLTSTSAGYKEAKQIFSAADTRVEGKSVVIDK